MLRIGCLVAYSHLSDPRHTECSNLTEVRWTFTFKLTNGNLLLGTTIDFLIAIVKMFYIS